MVSNTTFTREKIDPYVSHTLTFQKYFLKRTFTSIYINRRFTRLLHYKNFVWYIKQDKNVGEIKAEILK